MSDILERQLKEYYGLWNQTNALYTRWAKDHGMTCDALFVLYAIYYGGGNCRQKEICREWSMPKQTASSILKNFEEKGYLSFQPDEADRRGKKIGLTEVGYQAVKPVMEELERTELAVVRRIGQEKMETLLEINRMFCQYFQEEMER